MLLSKKEEVTSVGEDVKKREFLCTVGGNVNWHNHYGESMDSLKKLKIELPYDCSIPLLGIYLREMKSLS